MFSWQLRRANHLDERKDKQLEIHPYGNVNSVAFLADGKGVVSGGNEGKIQRWRVEDGEEVGTVMEAGSAVCSISASQDGRWVVSGLANGWVSVWDLETHEQVIDFQGHSDRVCAVDVSPNATQIATGSLDRTACVWSISTGERLLGPLQHKLSVVAARFSPDGRLFATATFVRDSVRIYDCQSGQLLHDLPIKVASPLNGSLAWDKDNKRLFALSSDANVNCLDLSKPTAVSKWRVHNRKFANCIALARDGRFIVASCELKVSFWDTESHTQIGDVIEHNHAICSMAISTSDKLAMGGGSIITFRALLDILPSHYFDNTLCGQEGSPSGAIEDSPSQEELSVEKTIQKLRDELAQSRRTANEDKDSLNATITSLRADLQAQETNSNKKVANLEQTIQELQKQLSDSQCAADQREESYKQAVSSLRKSDERSGNRIAQLEKAVEELSTGLTESRRKANNLVQIIHVKSRCEALYAEGRIIDTALSLLDILNPVDEEIRADKQIMDWLSEFSRVCITTLERIGDEASDAERPDGSVAAYDAALLLTPSTPETILAKWTSLMLIHGAPREVFSAAGKFKLSKFLVYRTICDILEAKDHYTEATECFQQMRTHLSEDADITNEGVQWELDFRGRCSEKLERLGDNAMGSENYDEATRYFSNAVSLEPANLIDILVKRSKVLASLSAWEEALKDADRVIDLDASYFRGYERKHAALHAMERYSEAFGAYKIMLSKLEQSPDPLTRELRRRYIDATPIIRMAILQAIQPLPRVLVNITTGRLCHRAQQAAAFEELPIYDELRSSMTTVLDQARIREAAEMFYRYVMLSHRWQSDEPTFQMLENMSVYGLPTSPANSKLQSFCDLVRSLRFQWAWSDTCCVDQLDKVVQQESLVAMFKWYRGSSLTIVHLLGVLSESQQLDALWKSIWNTRGWTFQEYVASQVVQFYTQDWKPYLGLDIFNHKESWPILSEMERATNFATEELSALRPGLDMVREKLYLASGRHTTREEDIAYCLFGIFNVAIPVIYGEGDQAVSRLLEHVLTGSGDVTILSWTGHAGTYNSCLPIDLTVYDQIVPPHVPQPIETIEMDSTITTLRSTLADLSLTVTLYRRLHELPSPLMAANRLRLPGIVFSITELEDTSEPNMETEFHVYRATTFALGEVEIKTTEILSGMKDLVLIHPWIGPLLDQEFACGAGGWDETTRALRLVVRLRQPFGALLLAPLSRVQYRRVAADSLIMVRVHEEVSLAELMGGIRVLDVQ